MSQEGSVSIKKEDVSSQQEEQVSQEVEDDPHDYPEKTVDGITLVSDKFGLHKDPTSGKTTAVKRFTWSNKNYVTVQAITYGATVTKILVPGTDGQLEDVVMGFDDMEGYQGRNHNIGCTVGRVANRTGNAQFTLEGKTYHVDKNIGEHHLHGGFIGFDKRNWTAYVDGTKVKMSLLSPDGDAGYPGDVLATVTYYLDKDNAFHIEFEATTTKATIINLTNHSYFNLGGHGSGHEQVYKHLMTINADRITVTDKNSIPTGQLRCIGGTTYDFRVPRLLGPALARAECNGFDNNFCIVKGSKQGLTFMARVFHPPSGRCLELYSDQPGVQLYTSNSLPNPDGTINPMETHESQPALMYTMHGTETATIEPVSVDLSVCTETEDTIKCECDTDNMEEPIIGKGGAKYTKHGAFCLEPQKYPDAVNHPAEFESTILRPGQTYRHNIIFKFVTATCTA